MRSQDKASGRYYKQSTKAKVRDLEFYLGEDWIDYGVISADIVIAMYKNIATSAYQPNYCKKCNRYWHLQLKRQNYKVEQYLKDSVFKNIPAIKKNCSMC